MKGKIFRGGSTVNQGIYSMPYAVRILLIFAVAGLSVAVDYPSAPPPRSAAKERGVSATCRLRDGGSKFMMDAALAPADSVVIFGPNGQEVPSGLSNYWKITLDKPEAHGKSVIHLYRKSETEPLIGTIQVRGGPHTSQDIRLTGTDQSHKPVSVSLFGCSEVRIRQ
jgi:hypothetical protein